MDSHQPVLVVEDEANIRDLVCLHLGVEGFTCVQAANGLEALELAQHQAFALVVLDLMLPKLDGVAVCRALRRSDLNSAVPILMLTARREEADKVLGLDSGADDYLTKPFGVRELTARVRALLRRRALDDDAAPAQPLIYKHLDLDPARRRVLVGGQEVTLTAHEFNLLQTLLARPGIVFSRDALLRRIWREDTFVTVRSVDTLVKRVRRKIEVDPSHPQIILTVWGAGYKVADG
ncbi:MAG: response regulator transcription factor [Vicinamibacterales bacterium]